jgi:hypothetical protein
MHLVFYTTGNICRQASSDLAIDSCCLEQNCEEARELQVLLEQHTAGSVHLPVVDGRNMR